MNILSIDTAGPVIGVGLLSAGATRSRTERIRRGSESRLVPWARELLAEAGLGFAQLDGIAVSVGPGAFTGIRVGMATALGLALAGDLPVWGALSLTSRAWRIRGDLPVVSLLDARKSRVYVGLFDAHGAMLRGPADIPPQEAVSWAKPPFLATGEGALVYGRLIEEAGGIVAPEADNPAVDVLATLGSEGIARGEGKDPADLQPCYLREPDARPPKPIRR